MSPDSEVYRCACGKELNQRSSGYSRHIKSCVAHHERNRVLARQLRDSDKRKIERDRQIQMVAQVEILPEPVEENDVLIEPEAFEDNIPPIRGLQSARSGQLTSNIDGDGPEAQVGRRPRRTAIARRLPKRFRDLLPEGPPLLPVASVPEIPAIMHDLEPPSEDQLPAVVELALFPTEKNRFGVFREYTERPLRIPDEMMPIEDLCIGPGDFQPNLVVNEPHDLRDIIKPFPNFSTYLLGNWYHLLPAGNLSRANLQALVDGVINNPEFRPEDFRGVKMAALDAKLDELDSRVNEVGREEAAGLIGDGWIEQHVEIQVPTGIQVKPRRSRNDPDRGPPSKSFKVPGLFRRPLVKVIEQVFQSQSGRDFHFEPYKAFWTTKNSNGEFLTERVYDELYTSDSWLKEHTDLQKSPKEPHCDLPRAIAAMMLWSDATHVSYFGESKMWPIYLSFGNLSKQVRCKPSARACHHIAHIPSLPENIQDFVREMHDGKKSASEETVRHCRRELFQEVWALVLDPEFIYAYRHGVIVDCADRIRRRIYPRIFTYSADYPEKALIATIRSLGGCPCPLCHVRKEKIYLLGKPSDETTRTTERRCDDDHRRRRVGLAHGIIYEQGFMPSNSNVDNLLKEDSLVPTKNAFSEKLQEFNFDFFGMLAVDLMHEFELGVWKASLTHIIRILYSQGLNTVNQFNGRFRHIGNFGRSTIRSFSYMNVTDMKNWAARTYEDCLQCCIPCLEGLFPPPHDVAIRNFVFTLAFWHSLAKLRQHTDTSLKHLEVVTKQLGDELRFFARTTCAAFDTRETPKEVAARAQRALNQQKKQPIAAVGPSTAHNSTSSEKTNGKKQKYGKLDKKSKKKKKFSLKTVKIHLLGHYVSTIRRYGTTDSYSTQIGELEHRVVKGLYRRGQKRRGTFIKESTRLQRRQHHVRKIAESVTKTTYMATAPPVPHLPPFDPSCHHQIAKCQKTPVHLRTMALASATEPGYLDFITKLEDHLLERLCHRCEGSKFSFSERLELQIHNNILYEHASLRINYTTYNVYRDQDVVNPKTDSRRFVLVSAADGSSSPFLYARVLGIYHANVIHRQTHGNQVLRMELLYVRWLVEDMDHEGDFAKYQMDRVSYVHGPDAFGFIDPADVIRGCHLIPAFHYGRNTTLLPKSRFWDSPSGDWDAYYVNRFVDRDMMMRYLHCGIGHASPLIQVELSQNNTDDSELPEYENVGGNNTGNEGGEPESDDEYQELENDASNQGYGGHAELNDGDGSDSELECPMDVSDNECNGDEAGDWDDLVNFDPGQ